MQVGETVIYVDPVGKPFDALVTAVFSENCINVVYISDDETRNDTYGRQIVRETSVARQNGAGFTAHGRYFVEKA